ncbi:unnamed protein product [Lampetra fluviatilis]
MASPLRAWLRLFARPPPRVSPRCGLLALPAASARCPPPTAASLSPQSRAYRAPPLRYDPGPQARPHSGPRSFLARPPQEATAERLSSAELGPDSGSNLTRPHSGPPPRLASPPQEATAERLSSAELGPDSGSNLTRPHSGPPPCLASPPQGLDGLTGDWRSSPEALRKAFGRYGAQRSGVDPGTLWARAMEVEGEEKATLGEKLANIAQRQAEEEQRRRER